MRRVAFAMVLLAAIPCLVPSDYAEALPFSLPAEMHATFFDEMACRPPPWYRGWAVQAPFVVSFLPV